MNNGMGLYFLCFGVEFLHLFSLKNMLLTHSKDFNEKNGPNLYIIARFLQQVPAGSQDKNDF
jgi:hypothetical protein